jgi:hypothetical protein
VAVDFRYKTLIFWIGNQMLSLMQIFVFLDFPEMAAKAVQFAVAVNLFLNTEQKPVLRNLHAKNLFIG